MRGSRRTAHWASSRDRTASTCKSCSTRRRGRDRGLLLASPDRRQERWSSSTERPANEGGVFIQTPSSRSLESFRLPILQPDVPVLNLHRPADVYLHADGAVGG